MWYSKPDDLYTMPMFGKIYYGKKGSYVTRVPGGWIFVYLGGVKSRFLPEKYNHIRKDLFIDTDGLIGIFDSGATTIFNAILFNLTLHLWDC